MTGPSGVRGETWDERDPSLNLPFTTALASSWDPDIARRYGAAVAVEARAAHWITPTEGIHIGYRAWLTERPVMAHWPRDRKRLRCGGCPAQVGGVRIPGCLRLGQGADREREQCAGLSRSRTPVTLSRVPSP